MLKKLLFKTLINNIKILIILVLKVILKIFKKFLSFYLIIFIFNKAFIIIISNNKYNIFLLFKILSFYNYI